MEKKHDRAEKRRTAELVQEYRDRGYDVLVEPDRLPDLPADTRVDLLARKDDEVVLIEVKSRASLADQPRLRELARAIEGRPGWRFELVLAGAGEDAALPEGTPLPEEASSLGRRDVARAVAESEALIASGHSEAALLLAWSITEATLRLLADTEGISLRREGDPPYVLKQLAVNGALSREDYHSLMNILRLRNVVAHGFKPENEIRPDLVRELLWTTSRLLATVPDARPA